MQLSLNPPKERCMTKGDHSGPEEEDLKSPGPTVRIRATGSKQYRRQSRQEQEQESRSGQSSLQNPQRGRGGRQQEHQEMKGKPTSWKSSLEMSTTKENTSQACDGALLCLLSKPLGNPLGLEWQFFPTNSRREQDYAD
ncbi:hypothetical protein TNCV_2176801 [Trichonephila clavipes]|uniref:Uncharacterized protein n=1 Tax=Trichonephila clavipes TaxID=2585209 RepID=A0A8X6VU05_TRICX|nr:hypothetical protein TNCV_2176801 [Trichonephila clavipes]